MSKTSRARAYVGRWPGARFDDATMERMCLEHATGVFWKHCLAAEGLSEGGWYEAKTRDPRYELARQAAHAEGVKAMREQAMLEGQPGKAALDFVKMFDRVEFAPPTQKSESKAEVTGSALGGIQIVVGSIEELRALAAPKDEP